MAWCRVLFGNTLSREVALIILLLFSFRMLIFSGILRLAIAVVVVEIVIVIQIFSGKPHSNYLNTDFKWSPGS